MWPLWFFRKCILILRTQLLKCLDVKSLILALSWLRKKSAGTVVGGLRWGGGGMGGCGCGCGCGWVCVCTHRKRYSGKILTTGKFIWKIYGHSFYYSCNFSISLKFFPNVGKIENKNQKAKKLQAKRKEKVRNNLLIQTRKWGLCNYRVIGN